MIISDSLRQEHMPEMVYTLCRLSQNKITRKQLQSLITLEKTESETKSKALFDKVFSFSIKCGFIEESKDGIVTPKFKKEDLSDYRHFRYAIFKNIFHESETRFTSSAKWYVAQNIPQSISKGETIFSADSDGHYYQLVPDDLKFEEDFFNGFRFWMTALGLTSFYAPENASVILPAAHRAISDWLEFDKPLEPGSSYEFRQFIGKLREECPVFAHAIQWEKRQISSVLSSALRVLNNTGVISLRKINDAQDMWTLSYSNQYFETNIVTHVSYLKGV